MHTLNIPLIHGKEEKAEEHEQKLGCDIFPRALAIAIILVMAIQAWNSDCIDEYKNCKFYASCSAVTLAINGILVIMISFS